MRWKKLSALVLAVSMCLSMVVPMSGQAQEIKQEKQESAEITGREKLNFNQGWKFKREYNEDAISPDFEMEELKKWENVNLPHTVRLESYMNSGPGNTYQGDTMYVKHFPLTEQEKGKKLYIEFEGAMGVSDVWVNGEHMTTKLASKTGNQTMYGGYLPFVIDITDVVKYDGTDNVITVHVNNEDNPDVPPGKPEKDLDFTYFGGIYRDVWLEVCEPVHITNANFEDIVAGGGILVDYPEVSKERAEVYVKTHVRNESLEEQKVAVKTEIINAQEQVVAEKTTEEVSVTAEMDYSFEQSMEVKNPELWSLDRPYMHTMVSTILVNGQEVDSVETPIGIRKIEMHRDYGLKINGEVQEALVGTNRHQEYPYIGYAAPSSLQRRDAIKFRESGINVVRTGHYPPSKDFLDACDELGILVIEPTPGWQWYRDNDTFKNRVFNDIRQMVRRDRNRPCILAYETVLNETGQAPGTFTQEMAEVAKEEHPSAKTATENSLAGMSSSAKDNVSDIMYKDANRSDKAVAFQREYGDSYREQYSPENFFYRRVTRGTGSYYPGGEGAMFMQAVKRLMGNQDDTVYYHPVDGSSSGKGGAKGSDRSFLSMAEWAERTPTETDAAFIGSTSWIGIDHNRSYENNMAPCGLWDLNRIPKFSYYAMTSQRDVEENEYLKEKGIESGPMLLIASYWTEQAPVLDKCNEEVKVLGSDESRIILVYSNAEQVRLKVMKDGEELWSETKTPMTGKNRELLNHAPFEFLDVPYTAGSYLVAEGLDAEGTVIAEQTVHTAGEPAKLELKTDDEGIGLTADGSDLMMVHAYVVDENGTVCKMADNELKFSIVSGDAKIVGDGDQRVGSNPIKAEAGITGAYIQAGMTPGDIVVQVEAEGLESAQITIPAEQMTEKAAAYTEIEYTGTGEDISGYLSNKQQLNTWGGSGLHMTKETITVGEEKYRNSISVYNNMELRYDLEGKCKTLSGSVYVKPDDEGKAAIFRAYVDGVQKYVSPVVHAGEVYDFHINVSGGQELTMTAEDQNADLTTKNSMVWMSPYVYEGNSGTDESELYQNLALNKPATATSSVDDTDSSMGNDGNVSTIWRGEEVHEGENANPQEWIVDLEGNYNVRNAKLGLEHDSIAYTYEIYTSSDGEKWDKQITNTKSPQASDVLDEFTAQNVRYVKVRFTEITEHPDRNQFSNATVSEFEIYQDMGVASTDEYNLKGLSVDNKDLVFDPATKKYIISLHGYESELRVRALPISEDAKVTVNGQQIALPQEGGKLTEVEPIVLTDLGEDNQVVVEVTAKSGAKTSYVIQVEGTLGRIYDSGTAKLWKVTGNGEENWYYGQREKATGAITDLDGDAQYAKNGEFYLQGAETYMRNGKRYTHPSNNYDAIKAFEAPKDGTVQASFWAEKYATNVGDVGISILKNAQKVWPEQADYEILSTGEELTGEILLDVKKGDRIQFVLDSVNGEASDATCLEPTVRYLDDFRITNTSISGPEHIRVENGQAKEADYQLKLETDTGMVIENVEATWSLVNPVEGVTITEKGHLQVDGDVQETQITIQAVSRWNQNVPVTKDVRITRHEYEETEVYLSDLEWCEESKPTEWGVAGKDRILSSDGLDNTKLSLPDENGNRVYYDKGIGVNSYSEIIYDVKDKGYVRFESMIGIDYTKYQNKEASVTFEVWADSEKVYESENITSTTPQQFVSVDISDADKVKLVVTYGSDGKKGNDNGDWADAKFIAAKDVTAYSIQGKVEAGDTQLTDLTGIEVELYEKDDKQFENVIGRGVTNAAGEFSIDTEVTNGDYVLKLKGVSGKYQEDLLEIQVDGADMTTAVFTLKADGEIPENALHLDVLRYALQLAEDADLDGVIETVAKKLEDACAHGQEILNLAEQQDPSVTQEMVDEAWQEIIRCMQYLEFRQGDKTDLEKVILMADSIVLEEYLEEGQQVFTDALTAAKGVLADGDAMQDEVNATWKALLKAMSELRRIPDKSKLEDLLEQAETIDRVVYTEESLDNLDQAYAYAIRVYNNTQSDEKQVEDAQKKLQVALEQLTAQGAGGIGADKADDIADYANTVKSSISSSSTEQTGTTAKSAKTGDNSFEYLYVWICVGALCLIGAVKKRNIK